MSHLHILVSNQEIEFFSRRPATMLSLSRAIALAARSDHSSSSSFHCFRLLGSFSPLTTPTLPWPSQLLRLRSVRYCCVLRDAVVACDAVRCSRTVAPALTHLICCACTPLWSRVCVFQHDRICLCALYLPRWFSVMMRAVGGEVASAATLAPKVGPLGMVRFVVLLGFVVPVRHVRGTVESLPTAASDADRSLSSCSPPRRSARTSPRPPLTGRA